MKKLLSVLILFTVSLTLWAGEKYTIPTFEQAENAFVFDARELRADYDDFCKVINLTDYCGISFDVFGMRGNKDKWYKLGTAELNGLFDQVRLSTSYDHDLHSFRYFAIVPNDSDTYDIEMTTDRLFLGFTTQYFAIFIIKYADEEPDTRYKDNAAILDMNTVRGRFENRIKIVNNTFDRGIQITLYGYDNENDAIWEPIGNAYLKGKDDEEFIITPLYKDSIPECRYYAVVSLDGTKYDIRTYVHHETLYIELD